MATGDPVTRRVIFGTYVIPTYSIEGEETSVRHTEFQVSPAGTLGGKGTASIDEDQWGDGWVSFSHQGAYWEDQSDVWELQGETWDGTLGLTTGGVDLTDDTSPCKFLYIKNTGTTNNALIALDGGTNYYITIPPNGSVALRGDGTQLLCSEVYVKSNTSTTTIEFIIAK
jgi:hypothetical protein